MENEPRTSEKEVAGALSSISLAGLIEGFRDYIYTWRQVVKHPRRLAEVASPTEPPIGFKSSVIFSLYGVLISFVIYLPLVQIHGLQLTKIYYFVQFLYFQVIYVFLMHISAKVFGGKASLKNTASIYCTWLGISAPTAVLLFYPLFVYMPVADFINLNSAATPSAPQWVWIWTTITFVAGIVVFFLLPTRWAATVHKMKTRWLFLGLLVIYFPLMGLHNAFIAPYVSRGLAVSSEFLINLL